MANCGLLVAVEAIHSEIPQMELRGWDVVHQHLQHKAMAWPTMEHCGSPSDKVAIQLRGLPMVPPIGQD